MAMQDQDFWRRIEKGAPGLFDIGTTLYGMNAANRENAGRMRDAQGPLYDQAMAGSGAALARAGSMDPRAAAAERFNAQQGLLAGKDAADEDALMRMLHQRGLLGAASFNPGVEGVTPSGTAMNPQMAAFYAARNARNAKMSADSLDAGEAQTDRMIKRSGMLQDQALNKQRATMGMDIRPSRAAQGMNLMKGAAGILKDTGALKDISGLLGKGFDWLGGKTGMWGDTPSFDEWGGGGYDFDWWSG